MELSLVLLACFVLFSKREIPAEIWLSILSHVYVSYHCEKDILSAFPFQQQSHWIVAGGFLSLFFFSFFFWFCGCFLFFQVFILGRMRRVELRGFPIVMLPCYLFIYYVYCDQVHNSLLLGRELK